MKRERGASGGKMVWFGAAGALLVVLCAPACREPLLSPDEERSPFDRYDAIRDQRAPSYIEDEYGRRRPNLRARLLDKE